MKQKGKFLMAKLLVKQDALFIVHDRMAVVESCFTFLLCSQNMQLMHRLFCLRSSSLCSQQTCWQAQCYGNESFDQVAACWHTILYYNATAAITWYKCKETTTSAVQIPRWAKLIQSFPPHSAAVVLWHKKLPKFEHPLFTRCSATILTSP